MWRRPPRQELSLERLEALEGQYRASKDRLGQEMHRLYKAQLEQRYAESRRRMQAAYDASPGSRSGRGPRPRFD